MPRTRATGARSAGISRAFARAVLVLLAATLPLFAATRAAQAAPLDPQSGDWEGLSQLVRMAERELGTQRVVVTSTLRFADLRREDGVLLVHPTRPLDVDELSAFMRAGGRLALLDDYGTGDELLARFGIRRVAMPSRPLEMLRGNPALAIAEPASAHPTVRDVGRIVTNHATGLEHAGLSPLLVVRASGDHDVLLAMAGAVGRGRLVAVGDSSLAINSMLRYPGNRALAVGLERYLVDDDVWGTRGGKLYLLVNGFEATGSFGDPSRAGGALADSRRALAEGFDAIRRDGLSPVVAYLFALATGLGVIGWTSARVGRTHRPVAPRFARPLPAVAQGGIAGHAAVLGSPDTARVLGILELKSALEENLATRLGLERAPPPRELVSRLKAEGILDERRAGALAKLLEELGRVEMQFARASAASMSAGARVRDDPVLGRRGSDARVLSLAARVRDVLDAVRPPGARGRVEPAP